MSVLEALAADRIHPILLKGTALAYTVYEAPSSRPRSDTDLLVGRQDVDAVRRIMAGLGYAATNFCDGERLFHQFEVQKEDAFAVSHTFDIHWKISTQSVFADTLTYQELRDAAWPIPGLGAHARGAAPVHALLLACIHPVMHHRNVERLIWIYDVHLLASKLSPPQLETFTRLALEKRVATICAHELRLARTQFATKVPDAVVDRLESSANREPSAQYLRPGRRWHDEIISSAQGLPGWQARAQLVREVLFPNPRYMLAAYGAPADARGVALLPAFYIHRAVRGVWRVLTGRK
jgi:hypothetical protein